MPAFPRHPVPGRSGKALQDSEQDGAGTLPKPGKGAGASSGGGPCCRQPSRPAVPPAARPARPPWVGRPRRGPSDPALSSVSPCRSHQAPVQPHGLTSAPRKLHSNLSTRPSGVPGANTSSRSGGKEDDSYICNTRQRRGHRFLSLSFPFLHMQLQRGALFGFAPAAAAALQRAPATSHPRNAAASRSSPARPPLNGEERDTAALAFALPKT